MADYDYRILVARPDWFPDSVADPHYRYGGRDFTDLDTAIRWYASAINERGAEAVTFQRRPVVQPWEPYAPPADLLR